MRLEVYGLIRKEAFQKAKAYAKDLHEANPNLFSEPFISGLFEFDWEHFIAAKKKELKGIYWSYCSPVIVLNDNEVIGTEEDLKKWAEIEHGFNDYRPLALYTCLAQDEYKKKLFETNRIYVSMLIKIDEERCGAMLIELYSDILPKTCENFRALCTGELGEMKKNEVEKYKMSYKGTKFFRLIKNGWIQGGDILYSRGNDGCSIYGLTFEDENFAIKHDRRGILSMVNAGRHTNGSQFLITLAPTPWMDKVYVAFGRVIEGSTVLDKMEAIQTQNERPIRDVCIADISIVNPLDLSTKIV